MQICFLKSFRFFFSLNYLTCELRRTFFEIFWILAKSASGMLGEQIEGATSFLAQENRRNEQLSMRRYSYILSFLSNSLWPRSYSRLKCPRDAQTSKKIENRNSKVRRKCSVRTESAQIQLLPAAKSVISGIPTLAVHHHNAMLCQQLTS